MPFIGQDWRAPGETWVRTRTGESEGWEQLKLRPKNISETSFELRFSRNATAELLHSPSGDLDRISPGIRDRNDSESSADNVSFGLFPPGADQSGAISEAETGDEEDWQPHCFVKTCKSKEFVGCASMSEAFHKLNIAREVDAMQRFNYICKVVQILIQDKLQNLSGSARKVLLVTVEAIVLHSLEKFREVKTVRELLQDLDTNLNDGQHCGSPKLLSHHQDTVCSLIELISSQAPRTPAESNEDCVTFVDLPRECLRAILRRLDSHTHLVEASKAHEVLESLVESEQKLWKGLCQFHFTPHQIKRIQNKLNDDAKKKGKKLLENLNPGQLPPWRHTYFELKKFFGLKEVYADMIHICCHCKALFWKGLGHPCIAVDTAPCVRVTPQQFVDMLIVM